MLILIYLIIGAAFTRRIQGRLPELSVTRQCGERLSAYWERLPLPAALGATGIVLFGFLASLLTWLAWPLALSLRMVPAHRVGC